MYLPEELHPPRSDKALLSVNAYKCCIFIMLICLTTKFLLVMIKPKQCAGNTFSSCFSDCQL